MPWMKVKRGSQTCVYKKSASGEPEGNPLGCHDSEKEADAQIAALHIHVHEAAGDLSFNTTLEDLTEAASDANKDGARGSLWSVTIIKAGTSNSMHSFPRLGIVAPYHYTREALASSVSLFEGAKVFANREGPHVPDNQKSVHDEVGWISDIHMVGDEMKGNLHFLPSATWLRENLVDAYDKGKKDIYELSIHAGGDGEPKMHGGKQVMLVNAITVVSSVDVVPKGAAGGKFVQLLESLLDQQTNSNTPRGEVKMKSVVKKLLLLFTAVYPVAAQTFMEAQDDWTKIDENALFTALYQADKPQDRLHLPDGAQLTEALVDDKLKEVLAQRQSSKGDEKNQNHLMLTEAQKQIDDMQKKITALHVSGCGATLKLKLTESQLPIPIQEVISRQFEGKVFTEAELADAIKTQRDAYAKLFDNMPKRMVFAEAGMDSRDKVIHGLEGFFLLGSSDHAKQKLSLADIKKECGGIDPIRSFREAYVMLTGDEQITGLKSKSLRMTESLATTDLPQIVADALNKRLVRDYAALALDTWRTFVQIVPLSDFKTQHRVRYGGYPNLPVVAEGAPYVDLGSPTDEEATYSASKYGGTEDLTRELIKNDDVGAIQRIPSRMARAAAQTLHEFVYDFIRPGVNPTIYDAVALYHATHANTGTTALDATRLAAARLRMKKQAMMDNSKRLGLRARYLVVPSDLEETAYGLLTPSFNQANTTPTFLQQIGVTPIVVDYWADANDWVVIADQADVQGLELGFVDGQETPQIFVSDLPNVGSWFTNDKVTFKIRHEYGGAIIDYRAFDGSIVA